MSDLNERLDQAFHAIEPGSAPVEAAMGHGRKIRRRRQVAVLTGTVAVIAAAVVSIPVLSHHQALPSPASPHIRVTVNPPGPHAPAGTIASGLIGTKPWDLRLEAPGTKNCSITGIGMGVAECYGSLPTPGPNPIELDGSSVSDTGSGRETYFVSYGVVRKDVAFARVVLANGTVLTLTPTPVYGMRWVAFANPAGVPVDRLTAYSRTGAIATAIPFSNPASDGSPAFSTWLRPGQAGAARFSKTVASGRAGGQAWAVITYIGPWGTCVYSGGTGTCFPVTTFPGTGEQGSAPLTQGTTVVWGTAAEAVSYLIFTPKGGIAQRVGVTAVGPQKYFALSLSHTPGNGDHWTAYNSAGRPVASGSL